MAGTPIALSEDDLQTMVDIVATAGSTIAEEGGPDPADSGPSVGLPWWVLHRIRALVRCDELSWHDLESAQQRTTFLMDARDDGDELTLADGFDDPADDPFWQHYWQSPCSYPERSGDLRGVTMRSDFYSAREWRATPFYLDDADRLQHSMLLTLPGGPGRTLRLVAFRQSGPTFSERDRSIFLLLRPHLYAIHLRVERQRRGIPDLTERQWQLLQLVALGHTNGQIARRLGVAEGTVRKHMENIHSRLGVTSRAAALARAFPDRFATALHPAHLVPA
ncbi:hypothetical protein GCM10009789_71670 [Kribbella sancticallisti]|uniref:HTH luxR-type domain-containing protein n=1 Tax=Kribbella sancticallisti TaxID=460087 RepID=A0ABN2EI28_9ACTN